MNIQSPLRWIIIVCATVVESGCIVYRYVPPAGELTPAQHQWLDSVSAVREAEFARILVEDRGQRRPRLTRNPVLDLASRLVVVWSMGETLETSLAVRALQATLDQRRLCCTTRTGVSSTRRTSIARCWKGRRRLPE